jgi:hypothetical protein
VSPRLPAATGFHGKAPRLSFLTRFRRAPAPGPATTPITPATGDGACETAAGGSGTDRRRPRWQAALGWAATVVAAVLVLFALGAPNRLDLLTPGTFVSIPLEGLVGTAVMLVLPARVRRPAAIAAGLALGLLLVGKFIDMGFYEVLVRPFDPVLDWVLISDGVEVLGQSIGRAGAVAVEIGAVVLVVAVLAGMVLSVLRLTRLITSHRTASTRALAVLGVAWACCAVIGIQVVPGVPVADGSASTLVADRARRFDASLRDKKVFAAQAAVDPFRDTPADQMLTALRGKDVTIAFVESYGRSAIENPDLAPQIDAVLDDGTRQLKAAGFESRSAFLTSPTTGGGSWLAHSTLLSGLWINNQQRYHILTTGNRMTLNQAFRRATWRTVAIMPGTTRAWPEGKFYGYNKIYPARSLGYHGPNFTLGTMPDQFTLSAFERVEYGTPGRGPLMTETALASSHSPWTPIPRLLDWKDIGDGSVYGPMATSGGQSGVFRGASQVRADYARTIQYTLGSLISFVTRYGNDNTVLIFLGDHQPAPIVTGDHASHDVPITIIAHDPAVLNRISSWGWEDGLRPDSAAPVSRMDTFRNRFLTAFGSTPHGAG